jgi:hypothetical protein
LLVERHATPYRTRKGTAPNMLDLLRIGKRSENPHALLEQIAAKYPDCEKQRRIFLAKVSDDPRFMAYDHRARVRRLDDIAHIAIMCTQPQRTRFN